MFSDICLWDVFNLYSCTIIVWLHSFKSPYIELKILAINQTDIPGMV